MYKGNLSRSPEEEMAEEQTINASDRVLLALQRPAVPDDLVALTGLAIGTVQNALTRLKREKLVETTGKHRGKAQEVRLPDDGEHRVRAYLEGRRASPSPFTQRSSDDGDAASTPDDGLLSPPLGGEDAR